MKVKEFKEVISQLSEDLNELDIVCLLGEMSREDNRVIVSTSHRISLVLDESHIVPIDPFKGKQKVVSILSIKE